jgi:hypothetical protein
MQTESIPYTFIRGGYFYFSRRVTSDLQHHYGSPRVVQGLRTTSPQRARAQANITVAKLDAYWIQMRMTASDVIGSSLIKPLEADLDNRQRVLSSPDTD